MSDSDPAPAPRRSQWPLSLGLMALTFVSMLYAGADVVRAPRDLLAGLPFALPLMAILLTHEMGHFIAGKRHHVDISPPFFIPMPIFLLGTMGAVIQMRGRLRTRNALLDVGAAGPLAGLCVAIPVLVYGISTSPLIPMPHAGENVLMEGHSLLYAGLLRILKGPIPSGEDIQLSKTAFAGWAGLLMTMINLIPCLQLDGGHVAYALLGKPQDAVSRWIRRLLPLLGLGVAAAYGGAALAAHAPWSRIAEQAEAGAPWLLWSGMLFLMARLSGDTHPEAGDAPLSPARKWVAAFTLLLFVLLFMPSWLRAA